MESSRRRGTYHAGRRSGGLKEHQEEGLRYVYMPRQSRTQIQRSAVRHLVETLFEGSAEQVLAALLARRGAITPGQLDRMAAMIQRARPESGRSDSRRNGPGGCGAWLLLRRRPAAKRHFLWAAAIAPALALPVPRAA
jgi:hypothetical protein